MLKNPNDKNVEYVPTTAKLNKISKKKLSFIALKTDRTLNDVLNNALSEYLVVFESKNPNFFRGL